MPVKVTSGNVPPLLNESVSPEWKPLLIDTVPDLAEELMAQRAADRNGETVDVLIEEEAGDGRYEGRAAHQAPEVDGVTTVTSSTRLEPGAMVRAVVTGSDGVDLIADLR